MRILAIADEEAKKYWDYYKPGMLDEIDLIVSCGDLDPRYLSFLATLSHAPVIYVHGNHDDKYERIPPDGCICIDREIYLFQGVRFLGIDGCVRYRQGKYQYSQEEMNRRMFLLKRKIRKYGGFDILVTHAPAYQVGDGEDLPHQGFRAFRTLLDIYRPEYYLHGHVHTNYGRNYRRLKTYNDTLIINPYESYVFEYETERELNLQKTKDWEERHGLGK